MKITKLKLDQLKPYEGNAKLHPESQIEQIMRSIQEFGNNDPIAVDEHYVIIEGHGRYEALKRLGYEEAECIVLRGMTEDQKNAYRLVHNKLTMNSDFDLSALEEELDKIEGIDMEQFDFDIPEPEPDYGDYDADQMPDVDETNPTKTKRGDLYRLGEHYLLCGDATRREDVQKLMRGRLADMVLTDPPYGMGLDTDFSSMINHLDFALDFAKEKRFKGGKKYEQGIVDDFKPELIKTIFDNFGYCKEIFIFGSDYFAEMIPERNKGSWIVWDKRANGNDDIEEDYSSDKMYGSCFELCWSKNKHKRDIARVKWAGVFGTEQEFDKKRYHPTQKPIKLISWFIARYSDSDNVIVDLYGGSGSTLISCEQLGRICYTIELDPKYCDVIVKRWEDMTGEKAELVASVPDGE